MTAKNIWLLDFGISMTKGQTIKVFKASFIQENNHKLKHDSNANSYSHQFFFQNATLFDIRVTLH